MAIIPEHLGKTFLNAVGHKQHDEDEAPEAPVDEVLDQVVNPYTEQSFLAELSSEGPLTPDHYKHHKEDIYRRAAEKVMFSGDSISAYYKNVTEPLRKPDLTALLKCSDRQLPEIYNKACWIAGLMGIEVPDLYVCHLDMIGMNAEGISAPWIEIYSMTVTEMSSVEMDFLLGRSMAHVHCNHLLCEVLMEGVLEASNYLNRVPGVGAVLSLVGPDRINQALKFVLYPWNRASEYTADFAGYLCCGGNLNASCSAIMKSVLRSKKLADMASLKEFYKQIEIIDSMTGYVATYSKLDDKWPYAQYRIRELIRYASSARGKKALRLVKQWEAENVRA